MKSTSRKQKEHSKYYTIVVGVGVIALSLPIYAVMCIKNFFKNRKQKNSTPYTRYNIKWDASPIIHYKKPKKTVEDSEFLSRIDEFTCFQYRGFNRLSGKRNSFEFFASQSPELKEYVLNFFANHPIDELLYGNINSNGCDMDDWEICLVFENQNLNHCIRGYGTTDVSAPFLRELVPYLFCKQNLMYTLDYK